MHYNKGRGVDRKKMKGQKGPRASPTKLSQQTAPPTDTALMAGSEQQGHLAIVGTTH